MGNFHEVQIFAIFATHDQNTKIRTAKISRTFAWTFAWTFEHAEIFTRAFCALVLVDLTMVLYLFKPEDDVLPSLTEDIFRPHYPGDDKGAWSVARAKREN